MSRFSWRSLSLAGVLFLVALAGAASAQPTPGPGPWSSNHPLWFDLNGDGTPQGNELTGYPTFDGYTCTQVVGIPTEAGAPTSSCAEVYVDDGVGGSRTRPNGVVQTLFTNAEGTLFTFSELPYSPPGMKALGAGGVKALAPSGGTGQLLDTDGDGIYESLQVEGTRNGSAVPQTRMSLVLTDETGDGRPDYVSVPWTTSGAGMLGVSTGSTPRIYVPLTDTNADGWPDTITVQVAGGGISTTTGPPISGAAAVLVGPDAIPTVGTFGLVLFAAALVAVGLKLLRGPAVVS